LEGKVKGNNLSDFACIGIDSFVVHDNEVGNGCYVNGGVGFVSLPHVVEEVRSPLRQYNHEVSLIMHTVVVTGTEPIVKGKVRITITECTIGEAVHVNPSLPNIKAAFDMLESAVQVFLDDAMRVEQSIPDIMEGMSNVRAPYAITERGAFGKSFLPNAGFAMTETPRANAGFFENAFAQVMKRRGLNPAHYVEMPLEKRVQIASEIICYPIQTLDYKGDFFYKGNRRNREKPLKIGNEEMSNILVSLAGDCEDGGKGIYSVMKAFVDVDFGTNKHMKEMQSFMRDNYDFFMTLCVVHGQEINTKNAQKGAHMYTIGNTEEQFKRALSKTPEGRQFLQTIKGVDAPPPQAPSGVFSRLKAPASSSSAEKMKHLTCEGTGILGTYCDESIDKETEEANRYVNDRFSVAKRGKRPITSKLPSPFYEALLLCMSDKYVHTTRVSSFIMCSVMPDGSLRRGVMHTDIVQQKDNIAMVPYPPMKEDVYQACCESLALNPPQRDLFYDPKAPHAYDLEKNPYLERVVESFRGYGRSNKPEGKRVDIFFRDPHVNESLVGPMMSDLQNMRRVTHVTYRCEPWDNTTCNWCVSLYIK
jgi:hypothetical protein